LLNQEILSGYDFNALAKKKGSTELR